MGICICCCCNKKDTDCIENTLIIFISIESFFLLLGLILIDWKIVAYSNLAINLILFFILIFSLAILVIFKILRGNDTIYTKNRKLCYILGYIGMSFSIVCLFLSILSESLISENIYKYDHPCLFRLLNENINIGSNNHGLRILSTSDFNEEEHIKEICANSNKFLYYKRSAPKDIAMSYICSTIIEIFSLIGAFFWYNDIRRIKYCIKNRMNDERGLIIYGPLGGYMGQNSENNIETIKIKNDAIIYNQDNVNLNMNNIKNKNNNLSNNNSLNGDNNNIQNQITSVQNNEIRNEIDEESHSSNKIEVKKKKELSVSEDFY